MEASCPNRLGDPAPVQSEGQQRASYQQYQLTVLTHHETKQVLVIDTLAKLSHDADQAANAWRSLA